MSTMEIYNTRSVNDNLPKVFDFEGNQVRIITDQKGEPWFIAKDIASILGYRKATEATRLLEEDEKNKHIVGTPGGPQKCMVINELGVYSLAFVSRKAIAKRFKKWVTFHLPTIHTLIYRGEKSCTQ
jgi:prophage antirepressor-like protein